LLHSEVRTVKRLSVLLILVLLTYAAVTASAQNRPLANKVEHFFVTSDNPERLFKLFRDVLQLPEVWGYQRFGEFASGGLSLGNTVLEFLDFPFENDPGRATKFKGIAFEPVADADAAVIELRKRGIAHGEPRPFKIRAGGQERVGWVNVQLTDLPPSDAFVFLCDYKSREGVAETRSAASQELVRRGGGPLGILSLKEIVIGVRSVEEASRKWGRLLESRGPGAAPVFALSSGPRIRLVRADAEGIRGIVVKVKSRRGAEQFLAKNKMLGGAEAGGVAIAPEPVGGLMITLVED
jgi:hypothetical protein